MGFTLLDFTPLIWVAIFVLSVYLYLGGMRPSALILPAFASLAASAAGAYPAVQCGVFALTAIITASARLLKQKS